MSEEVGDIFEHGSRWIRADFHLHTRADKEFKFDGEDDRFVSSYVEGLQAAGIGLGVITNHNKFDVGEFKALRRKARKAGIGLLPGVELSVNDGSNGVHTLIVFSDEWLEGGNDYINQFLGVAFSGKVPSQYEQENGRSNDDLLATLKKLEAYGRDFFITFAHVEANSGLWKEISGGRMSELAAQPLIQKYTLGFQKVRTHDKADAVCRTKVQSWWGDQYPAEVEGSDPKAVNEIGKGQKNYVKIGDLGFDAVKFALTDHGFRVAREAPTVEHSHINAIRFEGGLLNGKRVTFSPHLNCLIGIQGSGKSSILESLRYALDLPFGDQSQDQDYKKGLLPFVLKSGGKIVVEATDRHGTRFEIRRLLGHAYEVYVDGVLRPGISIQDTIIAKPLYFGQKDLSAAGKGFGHDLVEKLMGDSLKDVRQKIEERHGVLERSIDALKSVHCDVEDKETLEDELKDVEFRLEQFDKHGVKEKLDKQLAFSRDLSFCESVDEIAKEWHGSLAGAVTEAEEELAMLEEQKSEYNAEFFERYVKKIEALRKSVSDARAIVVSAEIASAELVELQGELSSVKDGLKEEFAEVERELVQALEEQAVTSIEPDAYITLTDRKSELVTEISDLKKKTTKARTRHDEVLTALASLNDAWHEEYRLISTALGTINDSQGSLKVEGVFKGDKAAYKSHIDDLFKGSGLRKEAYDSIAKIYPDFGEVFKDLEEASKHAKSKATAFKELFLGSMKELLTFQIPNSYDVTYHGRPLRLHSLGQRASAMMLFLLSQKGNDLLLIDQPEDDLDSQTVYEEVVKILRLIKPRQQFIFATHNANFPVLGDAETITTCSATDDEISIAVGNIDDKACQGKVINIMEGGPEAFERRKTIYQIWKPPTE
jgi:predicted ATPase/cell division protein ZapA (FtsZ GTPase activity inhibitor)